MTFDSRYDRRRVFGTVLSGTGLSASSERSPSVQKIVNSLVQEQFLSVPLHPALAIFWASESWGPIPQAVALAGVFCPPPLGTQVQRQVVVVQPVAPRTAASRSVENNRGIDQSPLKCRNDLPDYGLPSSGNNPSNPIVADVSVTISF